MSASEVRDSWGASDIAAGTTQHARWTVTAGIPLGIAIEFRYQPSEGSSKRATVTFTCGPSIPPGTPPPTITSVAVHPPMEDLEPGDTLVVEYSVTGQAGLWLTGAALSGPCESEQFFFDSLRTTSTRTVRVPLPPGCALGRPIIATVFALDAGGREASRSINTQISLVDRTAPTITGVPVVAGDYFVGESLELHLHAFDNHALGALIWELLPTGLRDSIPLSGTAASRIVSVPLGANAAGSLQLRVYARDSLGHISNVVLTDQDAIRVHPTVARPTRSATISGDIREIAIDVPRGAIYALLSEQRRLTVISSATLEVIRTVELPSYPADLDLTAGGDSLLIVLPLERALAVYDLRTPSVAPVVLPLISVDTPTVQRPLNVRVASNGKAFIAFRDFNSRVQSILEVDFATGQQRIRPEARGTNVESDAQLARSPDGSAIILGNGPWFFQRYDAATDAFGAQRQPRTSGFLSMSSGGATIVAGLTVYDASLQFVRTLQVPSDPRFIGPSAVSVDGQFVYLLYWQLGIVRARIADGRVMDRTPNPILATHIRISPDGAMLVTIERQIIGSSKISTIDLR